MKIIVTTIALLLSLGTFCQQRYYVSELGAGSKDGRSWENASDALPEIINEAQPGDSIWVSAGTYYGGFQMKEGVSVFGGFAGNETAFNQRQLPGAGQNLTILDGMSEFRVLAQPVDFEIPTVWDGFVIQHGSSQTGAGVYLRKNGIIRRCIIRNNSALLPSIGDYLPQEGGVVFQVDKEKNKVWIIAAEDYGRNYHIYEPGKNSIDEIEDAAKDMEGKLNTAMMSKSRISQAIKAYRGGNKSDWYIPSAGEWSLFLNPNEDGTFSQTKTYEFVEAALRANGKAPLTGKKYWSSTTARQNEMPSAWYADFERGGIWKMNVWQYHRIRGVRYYDVTSGDGKGGGVFALAGSRIEGCLVEKNTAAQGSAICAQGEVVLVNNTIIGNELAPSAFNSSAIDGNSDVKVYNTVLAGNRNKSGNVDNLAGASYYAHSAVETSYIASGLSNIMLKDISEVGFVDVDTEDYRLQAGSSLATAGHVDYLSRELDTDLEGKNRILNQTVSVGAFQPLESTSLSHLLLAGIQIYPNPLKRGETLVVDLTRIGSVPKDASIEIVDMQGRKLLTQSLQQVNHIPVSQTAGVYLLRISVNGQKSVENRLIVAE